MRVLSTNSEDCNLSRVVMRREKEAGGQGTKVIMNLALNRLVKLTSQSSNITRITCIDPVTTTVTSYLLKTKLIQV